MAKSAHHVTLLLMLTTPNAQTKGASNSKATLPHTIVAPPLKWVGGKRWLIPHLKLLMDNHMHRRIVEPFCGGLAVSLGLRPERALLNDINAHVINFYRWAGEGLRITMSMKNDKDYYYSKRSRFNDLLTLGKARSKEAASLFYYLNRTGYNGLCRFNRSGGFNVPFGRHVKIGYVQDFSPYKAAFSGWDFSSKDFEELEIEPTDFIYADPPYDVEFTQYSKEGFGWNDQVRLAHWLADHPGPVIVSNQATTRIVKLYRALGFRIKFLMAPRTISCSGDRRQAREILAYKNI